MECLKSNSYNSSWTNLRKRMKLKRKKKRTALGKDTKGSSRVIPKPASSFSFFFPFFHPQHFLISTQEPRPTLPFLLFYFHFWFSSLLSSVLFFSFRTNRALAFLSLLSFSTLLLNGIFPNQKVPPPKSPICTHLIRLRRTLTWLSTKKQKLAWDQPRIGG